MTIKRTLLSTLMNAIAFSDILNEQNQENEIDFEWLSSEYQLIKQKKSKLSKSKRDWVVNQYDTIKRRIDNV